MQSEACQLMQPTTKSLGQLISDVKNRGESTGDDDAVGLLLNNGSVVTMTAP